MKKIKSIFLKVLFLVFVTFTAIGLVACNTEDSRSDNGTSVEVKDSVAYNVTYSFEKLDGSWEEITIAYSANDGVEVTAAEFPLVGYELDVENEKYIPTGIAKKDLQLQMPYKLKSNTMQVQTVENAAVKILVDDKAATTARYGEEVFVTATAEDGYVVESIKVFKANEEEIVVKDGAFVMPETAVKVVVSVKKDTNFLYTVEHWCKGIDNQTYELYAADFAYGEKGATVTATPLNNLGFAENVTHTSRKASGEIISNGSLTLKLYYERNTFSVSNASADVEFSIDKQESVQYGDNVTVSITEFVNVGYEENVYIAKENTVAWEKLEKRADGTYNFAMPAYNVIVKSVVVASDHTPYSVEYWCEDLTGAYALSKTETFYATTETEVSAVVEEINGFVYDADNENTVNSGIVASDGSLTLKLFYKRVDHVVTFLSASGTTLATKGYKHGATGIELPSEYSDYYLEDEDKYFYWSYEDKLLDEEMTVLTDISVQQKYYDKEIYTVADFCEAFGLVKVAENTYKSENVAAGSYILMASLDFNGATVNIAGLSGLLEGNGYSISNIEIGTPWERTGCQGLFLEMSGIIRNLSLVNITKTPLTNVVEQSGLGILQRSGLLAGRLSGGIENVYLNGTMRGTVYSYFQWDPAYNAEQLPYSDADGVPVAGFVAFDATGANLKNVVVDVESSYTDGKNTTLNIIAGKGLFNYENIFVISNSVENLGDKYATRGVSMQTLGIVCEEAENVATYVAQNYQGIKAWNSQDFLASINQGFAPMNKECVANSRMTEYAIYHCLAKDSVIDPANPDSYDVMKVAYKVGLKGEQTSAEALSYVGYDAMEIEQKTIVAGNENVVYVYYKRDMLRQTFETPSSVDSVTNVGGSHSITGNGGTVVRPADDLEYYYSTNSGNGSLCWQYVNEGANAYIRVNLTEEQKAALAIGGHLELYIKMVSCSIFATVYKMNVNGSYAYTIEANNSVQMNGENEGQILLQNYRGDYGRLIVDASVSEQLAKDGYVQLFIEEWVSGDMWVKNFFMWLDDITVISASEGIVAYKVNHYLANSYSSVPTDVSGYTLAKTEYFGALVGDTTAAEALTFDGYIAQEITQVEVLADGSTVVNVLYIMDPMKQGFEGTDAADYILECVPPYATVQEGYATFYTDNNDVTYYNIGAYTGNKCVVFDNVNGSGVGLLKIYLTDKQIEGLANGGLLTFYMRLLCKYIGTRSYTMQINGSNDYTLTLTEGAHENSVSGGNGTVTQTHYGNGYAKVTVGMTAAAQIATDGFLTIYTSTSADDLYQYVMIIDDVTVDTNAKYEFTLTLGESGETKTVVFGEKIGELPAIEEKSTGELGYWAIDGVEITADTVWNYTTNKTAEIVYYNPLVQSFEGATNAVFKEVVGGSATILEGYKTFYTDNSDVIYYNIGAYTGDKCVVFDNTNGNGVGLLRICLNDKQIEEIKNGGSLSFYMRLLCKYIGTRSYTMQINGLADYTATLTEGASGNSVKGGNGTVTQTHYGNGYAKVTVGAAVAAQIAKDGYLQIYTETAAEDLYQYVMTIDDITVTPKAE